MSTSIFPNETPNVTIENPKVRKAIRTGVDIIGAATFVAVAVDVSSPAFDIAAITGPITMPCNPKICSPPSVVMRTT